MNDVTLPATSAPFSDESAAPESSKPASTARRLRLWPAVVIVVALWLAVMLPQWLEAQPMLQFMLRIWFPIAATIALSIWWLGASRLRWTDRVFGLAAFVGTGAGTVLGWDPSLRGHGFQIIMSLGLYVLPVVTTALVGWLALTPFLRWPVRRVGLEVVVLLAWGLFTLLRLEGIDGSFNAKFQFRWVPTAEELFLAETTTQEGEATATAAGAEPLTLQPGDWPGFRGPARDGRLPGVRLATDWNANPPRQVWHHRVGPGWGSFALAGGRLYTQEQRGNDEVVVCYDAGSGKEIWAHRDSLRFEEVVSGAGPRATPTFHDGKLYALGAKGNLNCLDAATGRHLWSQNVMDDSKAKLPVWGFSSSPLVAAGKVTVFAGGPGGKAVLAYDALSGKPAWSAGEGSHSYCSPQLSRLAGTEQLLIATDVGLCSFDPAVGTILWQYEWRLKEGMCRVVQPTVLDDSDVLLGTGMNNGTRRVHVTRTADAWTAKEVSATQAISPYFNDVVAHRGHVYGFEGNFLTCVNLEDGKRQWRARGYGSGQLLLLPDQDLILVLSEKGAVALVEANPAEHKERCRFQAIEGKTWNHPVLAHGKLYVRNGEDAACFELAEAAAAKP